MTLLINMLFPGFLIAAALHDVRSFKIPNPLVAAFAACAPLAAIAMGVGFQEFLSASVLAVVVLMLGIIMFSRGWIGAGDIKLIVASSLWIGTIHFGYFLIAMALAGAVLAIGLVMMRKMPLPAYLVSQAWLTELHSRTKVMPYGVAIAAGGLVVWGQGMMMIA